MTITEYSLTITQQCGSNEFTKTLTYRGNENIIIKAEASDDDEAIHILIPRNIMEAFLKMIEI
jgi:hypothetical protein